MSSHRVLLSLACALFLVSLLAPQVRAGERADVFSVRRFLLAAGSNHGGAQRVELRFADTDAQSVSRVFQDLGGVDPADQILLLDAGPAAFRQSLAALERRMVEAGREHDRIELVVYYSGHSDEQGLLLEGERLDYQELRAAVGRLPADVRIIILDSCASGALTRLKGGARRPAFLLDTSTKLSGHAFLTSSSHDEAAQESDRLGGSFFTHALLSGLRGAADATQDHRVTLNEAYQFAYENTLARTEATQSGPQHPGYDIQMVGAGDLVMTDLHNLTAGLVLTKSLEGRLHVRDRADGLVIELQKPSGRSIELGLEPGDYRVFLDRNGRYFATDVTLTDGGLVQLAETDLLPMAVADTRARGEFPATSSASTVSAASLPAGDVVKRDIVVSLWPGMSNHRAKEDRTVAEVSLNLTFGRTYGIDGTELGVLANWNLHDVDGFQAAGGVNLVEGSLDGFQAAGIVNRVHHDAKALQFAGTANTVGGDVDGLQSAGVLNVAEGDCRFYQGAGVANVTLGESRGVQAAGTANYARRLAGVQAAGALNVLRDPSRGYQFAGAANLAGGDFRGVQVGGAASLTRGHLRGGQVSGAANVAGGDLRGAQVSGAMNTSRAVRGVQVTGALNLARGPVTGAQVSGGASYAPSLRGLQLSVINVCGDTDGAQVGVVNVARRVQGAQIGVINVANEVSGAPVGVLSLVRRGRHQLAVGSSDVSPLNVGIKLGNEHVYSVLAVGGESTDDRDRRFGGCGLGVEMPFRRFFGQIEAVAYDIGEPRRAGDHSDDGLHILNRATFGLGWQAAPRLAVVGGLAVNVFTSKRNEGGDLIGLPIWYADRQGPTFTRVWPGFFLGVQI